MLSLSEAYNKSVQEETTMTQEQLKTRHVGKQDPKRHLENAVETAMGDQVRSGLNLRHPITHYASSFGMRGVTRGRSVPGHHFIRPPSHRSLLPLARYRVIRGTQWLTHFPIQVVQNLGTMMLAEL